MFPRNLTKESLTPNPSEAIKIRKVMTIMAWVCLIIGAILSIITLGSYSDENLTLMIGIGFLVASVHIYVIGLFMALMFKTPPVNDNVSFLEPKRTN